MILTLRKEGNAMSDLPGILLGPIAHEHRDLMQVTWLAEHEKHEKTRHKEEGCTDGKMCRPVDTNNATCSGDTCTVTCPADCSDNGNTCGDSGCQGKRNTAAFHPAVDGWSTPPELHAR